jgi:hypothetical protein
MPTRLQNALFFLKTKKEEAITLIVDHPASISEDSQQDERKTSNAF